MHAPLGALDDRIPEGHGDGSRGRDRAWPGAEGETAPETLKQKDRAKRETLESSAHGYARSPKEQGGPLKRAD